MLLLPSLPSHHHTTPQHPRDTQTPRHPGSRALRAQDTAKGSRVYFLPCFTAPIVTIISNNIPVLFFIEPCLTFWKTCNTWVVLLGKCCLSGTSIWDKRGWWGLGERAQPCPHAPASGEPRWPQPIEHSSCSETAAPCGTRGCPAVPWLEHKAPSVPQLWESQREGPCLYKHPAAIKIPKPAATGVELTPHSPSHTIITTRCTGQTGWRQKSF